MKVSAIVPHLSGCKTLPVALESIRAAAQAAQTAAPDLAIELEIVAIEDPSRKGPAWARNRGLERATGEYVFFVDADDTVRRDFFLLPVRELERTKADFCFFSGDRAPLKRDYALDNPAQIRDTLLGAFFGYSFDDVRRWNTPGGRLDAKRELGYIWRVAFRREFIERAQLRFDESLRINEDAAFLCSCALAARHIASLGEVLYNYHPSPGSLASAKSRAALLADYKFASLAFRKRLDAAAAGEIWRYCEASCAFSALELLREGSFRALLRYLRDGSVRAAVRSFPLSFRHPATAAAITLLRLATLCCYRQ